MVLNSENVRVGVTGAFYAGPTTATAPTSASSALPIDYVDFGYVSDDGVTETRDRSTNQIRAWQNAALVREVVTESSITYAATLIETKAETVAAFYGAEVDEDGSVLIDPSKTGGRKSYVIDVIDGDNLLRIYLPSAEITDVGDQTYASGEAIGFEITVTAYSVTVGGDTFSAKKWYSNLVTEG